MSGPEARRLIARAREHLYAGGDRKLVIQLADSVISRCVVPQYVRSGYLVKATAYQADNQNGQAARVGREGIQTIMTSQRGPLDDAALTALKMLLPVYVESAVASSGRSEVRAQLAKWQAELRARLEASEHPDRTAVESIDAEFGLLAEMVEQYVTSRGPASRIRKIVRRYVYLFNASNSESLAALFVPGARLERGAAERGRREVFLAPVDKLYLGSAVKVTISGDREADKATATALTELPGGTAAVATCDLLATSHAGWARLVVGVQFKFVRDADGGWLIQDITRHP